jgi:hypothetical protein
MTTHPDAVIIQVEDKGADGAEIEAALRVLWAELRNADGLEVAAQQAAAPVNSKADAGAISALVLTVLGSGGAAVALTRVFGDWLTRYRTFGIKVKRGASQIEIRGLNPKEVPALVPQLERLLSERQR